MKTKNKTGLDRSSLYRTRGRHAGGAPADARSLPWAGCTLADRWIIAIWDTKKKYPPAPPPPQKKKKKSKKPQHDHDALQHGIHNDDTMIKVTTRN